MRPLALNDLALLLNITAKYKAIIHGFAIDSRQVKPQDLFFALPGARANGHSFLEEVKSRGALAAVVKKDYRGESFGLELLFVDDVLIALQDLARKILQKRNTKVVAITGSLGKTMVKDFAATLIGAKYSTFASPLSYNSQITLPLSILLSDEKDEVLILEMGMTHPGQIKKLVSIAPPDIALITTIAMQHVVNFSNGLEGIAVEKSSIFSHPKTSLALFHHECGNAILKYQKSCKSFSIEDRNADFFLKKQPRRCFFYAGGKVQGEMEISFPLKVYYQNFLAALSLAYCLEVPLSSIQKKLHELKLPPMRFERIEKKGIIFINDAYNANPDSMIAALEGMPFPEKGGRKIAVLSEMDALGSYSEAGHERVAKKALECVDVLFCVGERCKTIDLIWKGLERECFYYDSKEALSSHLKEFIKPLDIVLLKGARSWALEKILARFYHL